MLPQRPNKLIYSRLLVEFFFCFVFIVVSNRTLRSVMCISVGTSVSISVGTSMCLQCVAIIQALSLSDLMNHSCLVMIVRYNVGSIISKAESFMLEKNTIIVKFKFVHSKSCNNSPSRLRL